VYVYKQYLPGLVPPSFQFLVSATKNLFPAVAHSTEQISNSNNPLNSKQNLKSGENETGAQMELIDEKRQKISAYCPFKPAFL
jgi:hypothetical protein